jgi:hypothetical protein
MNRKGHSSYPGLLQLVGVIVLLAMTMIAGIVSAIEYGLRTVIKLQWLRYVVTAVITTLIILSCYQLALHWWG